MAVWTAQQLIQEVAKRYGDYAPCTPGGGSTGSLFDTRLNIYFPQDVGSTSQPLGAWVYGTQTADVGNRGQTNRAYQWQASISTLSFLAPWPAVPSTGLYEIHRRIERSRKLEALNDAIGQLGLNWYRPLLDTTLTTAANTWTYTLPALIDKVYRVELQVATDATLVGYPYVDAAIYDWRVDTAVDAAGNTTQTLQFGTLPPPNMKLRLLGLVQYADLVNDTDVLPLRDVWERAALHFLFTYALHLFQRWEAVNQPAAQVERLEQQAARLLQEAEQFRQQYAPGSPNYQVITPGRGTADQDVPRDRPEAYWGAFRMLH